MKRIATLLFSATMLLTMLGLVGCETESSSQAAITITPSSVTLGVGASQEFVASGWTDYTWSLSNNSAGTLSTKTGDSTIYTAVSTSNITQVLTCSGGTVTTSGTDGTNGTTTVQAQALIAHQ